MNPDLLTDTGFCDVCCEEREDVETCLCSITRCAEHREEGCPRCGAHWTDNYWPGGAA